jgi:hypothetical protein
MDRDDRQIVFSGIASVTKGIATRCAGCMRRDAMIAAVHVAM